MRVFVILLSWLIMAKSSSGQLQQLELSAYSNETEISAFESVSLKSGFHIPSGKDVRIFTTVSTPENRQLNSTLTGSKSFVLVRDFKVAGVRNTNLSDVRSLAEENQSVTYYDNWGRPIQQINVMASKSYKDVVKIIKYDARGKSTIDYSPYVDQASYNGSFKPNDLQSQGSFYAQTGWDHYTAKTNAPYSKTVLANTPHDKVIEEGAVGGAWQPGNSSSRTVRYEEYFNNEIDFTDKLNTRKVRKFSVNSQATEAITVPSVSGYYNSNELKVFVTKSSNWQPTDGRINTSEKYVDKNGQAVLERAFTKDAQDALVILSTYYVYSDLGELYFILPPALDPDVANLTSANIDIYGVRYRYDTKRRVIEKKYPGVQPHIYIYNARDQPVASQDPKQRENNQWSFLKYDSQGRQIISGLMTSTSPVATLRVQAEASTQPYETLNTTGTQGYTNLAWPTAGITSYNVVNYYDNYEIPGLPSSLAFTNFSDHSKVDFPTGLMTVSKTWALNSANTVLWTATYYDDEGQPIQSKTNNHLGGVDRVDSYFNFAGELVKSERKHTGPNGQKVDVVNDYTYDQVGKLLEVAQQINQQDKIVLSSNTYNEIGQLVDKRLHKKTGQSKFLQSIDYRYNERGWLTSINDPNLAASSNMNDGDGDSNPDLFGIQLMYNNSPHSPQYNGNVAAMQWKTSLVAGQSVAPPKMGYRYGYDALNQLTSAVSERNGVLDNAHDEYIKYDVGGNISSFGRYAFTDNSVQQIDSLVYTYSGYRSTKIDDVSTSPQNALGYHDNATESVEHTYDPNGNMIKDLGKGIDITYNHLNLPSNITFGANHRLELLYDRTGVKLQAKYINGGATYTQDYVGGIQYEQGQIAFVYTGEGRARLSGSTYSYEYDIKDHLNNVRVTFVPDPANSSQTVAKVVQQNSYYPYGLPMYGDANLPLAYASGEKSKFLYSDKELYDQGGLNWFDHGSRMYDPATGRWSVMDPAAQFVNPYLAMGNNPVMYVDPDGEFIVLAPIIYAAIAGGVLNTVMHWDEVKKGGWEAGIKAFGVGAFAGGLGAATGGAAVAGFGLSAGSVAAGMAAGSVGAMYQDMALGMGNQLAFGDPYEMSPERLATAAVVGGVTGGAVQGISNVVRGANFFTGMKPGATIDGFAKTSFTNDLDDAITSNKTFKIDLRIDKSSSNGGWQLLLAPGKLHKHHILPQQFRKWFAERGISNIDDYAVEIGQSIHLKGVHGNGLGAQLPGGWNKQWTEFIKANPNASPSEIFHHAEGLLKRYGLERLPYIPYR